MFFGSNQEATILFPSMPLKLNYQLGFGVELEEWQHYLIMQMCNYM